MPPLEGVTLRWVLPLEGLSSDVGEGLPKLQPLGWWYRNYHRIRWGYSCQVRGPPNLTLRSGFPLVFTCDVPNHNLIYLIFLGYF